MKIYNKVVIDMTTGKILEEDSFEYTGPVALCGGGGQGSGTVAYAEYIEDFHFELLDGSAGSPSAATDILAYLNAHIESVASTPYTDATRPSGAQAYTDYGTDIDAIQTRVDALSTIISGLDAETDWESYIDTIVAKVDAAGVFPTVDFTDDLASALAGAITAATAVLSSAPITAAVDAYETKQLVRFNRGTGQWAAGMATANAVNSSSFVIGAALRQSELERDVSGFEANLNLDTYRQTMIEATRAHLQASIARAGRRDVMLTASVAELVAMLQVKTQNLAILTDEQAKVAGMTIDAENQTRDYNLRMDVKEATWDLELLLKASSAVGHVGGGSYVPDDKGGGFQGALSGAASGASIGGKFGPVGAGIGAGVGGFLGLFS